MQGSPLELDSGDSGHGFKDIVTALRSVSQVNVLSLSKTSGATLELGDGGNPTMRIDLFVIPLDRAVHVSGPSSKRQWADIIGTDKPYLLQASVCDYRSGQTVDGAVPIRDVRDVCRPAVELILSLATHRLRSGEKSRVMDALVRLAAPAPPPSSLLAASREVLPGEEV